MLLFVMMTMMMLAVHDQNSECLMSLKLLTRSLGKRCLRKAKGKLILTFLIRFVAQTVRESKLSFKYMNMFNLRFTLRIECKHVSLCKCKQMQNSLQLVLKTCLLIQVLGRVWNLKRSAQRYLLLRTAWVLKIDSNRDVIIICWFMLV